MAGHLPGGVDLIPVYKKVDKVVRCFRPTAKECSMGLNLQGRSLSMTRGPNNFELIPYAIIDNAVKYAPNNSTISVNIEEKNSKIIVSISSLGPFLDPSERTKIFESGYRGLHAIKSKQTGTGIGLATVHKMIKQFSGRIFVEQESAAQEVLGQPYFMTKFTIEVPIA